jgi:inner membrane protein
MRLSIKLLFVLAMTLAILIPLSMIRNTIQERQSYRQQAVADIARSYAGAQTFSGPVLIVPYVETVDAEDKDVQGVVRHVTRERAGHWTFFPSTLDVTGQLQPDVRTRGLHKVRVYQLRATATAAFAARIPAGLDTRHVRRIGEPWLSYGMTDVRGLVGSPRLVIAGLRVPVEQGAWKEQGIHARLVVPKPGDTIRLTTRLAFTLGGTESLALVPLGGGNHFAIDSSWPHPQFTGSFLPRSRHIDAHGFRANWDVSSLASSAQAQYLQGMVLPTSGGIGTDRASTVSIPDVVGLSLVDPVNIYTQADRATKYGLLFVLLTFIGFFMFELIRQLPIHPIQYGLVGLAIAIFFLLLVSLSEHIAFELAYVVSSAACIGLIGTYLSAVLGSAKRGVGFAAMLALLYATLYGLLVSEDNALVMGSALLFAILAAIMLITRRVDWYHLSPPVR